jgi:hypothetical protein
MGTCPTVVQVTLRPSFRTALVPALTFALGATLASGVAAVASSNGKAVKTCETSKGYVVSAAKNRCPHGSHEQTVATRGPRGQRGPKGSAGKAGTDAKVTALAGTGPNEDVLLAGNTSVVHYLSAPAGTYVVSWEANFQNHGAGDGEASVHCEPSGGVHAYPGSNVFVPTGAVITENGEATMTLAEAGDINLLCVAVGSEAVDANDSTLIAIPVSSVTTSS